MKQPYKYYGTIYFAIRYKNESEKSFSSLILPNQYQISVLIVYYIVFRLQEHSDCRLQRHGVLPVPHGPTHLPLQADKL